MRYLPFILRHLGHTWIRTCSTLLAIVVCVFLFCTLKTIIRAINWGLRSTDASRLVVRHAVSLEYYLPVTHKDRIRSIPGVTHVSIANFFLGFMGAQNPDYSKILLDRAIDADEFLAMYPEIILGSQERQAFLEDQRGCIVGTETAKAFGWKTGDAFQLESAIEEYRIGHPFEFVIRGIYTVDTARYPGTDGRAIYFHHKYLTAATIDRIPPHAHTLLVGIADPRQAGTISRTIDQMFENSDRPTYTATENAFRAGFVSMVGNVSLILNAIGVAVTFTILLATANTMSMAVRERRKEIAVLKTLGFDSGRVMSLILAEALLLGVGGGVLGVALGHATIRMLPGLPLVGDALRQLPNAGLPLSIGAVGLFMALVLSLAAGLVPALVAYRARIIDTLRAL